MSRSEEALKLKEQGYTYEDVALLMGIGWGAAVSYVSAARQRRKAKPPAPKQEGCWYCGSRLCTPRKGSYHAEVKAKQEYEKEREQRHRTSKDYTQLAKGRLYRRAR